PTSKFVIASVSAAGPSEKRECSAIGSFRPARAAGLSGNQNDARRRAPRGPGGSGHWGVQAASLTFQHCLNLARDTADGAYSMTTLDDVAAATLRIEYGASRGSGFHFLQPEIVVTNHHVIEGAESAKSPGITGITEAGERINLALVAWSPKTKHDFAILRAQNPVPSGRGVLKPKGI